MLRLDKLAVTLLGVRARSVLLVRQASSVIIPTEKCGKTDIALDLLLAFVVCMSKTGVAKDFICNSCQPVCLRRAEFLEVFLPISSRVRPLVSGTKKKTQMTPMVVTTPKKICDTVRQCRRGLVLESTYESAELGGVDEVRSSHGDGELGKFIRTRILLPTVRILLTLLSQLEEPPILTPLARMPSGNTSLMMIHATGPQE